MGSDKQKAYVSYARKGSRDFVAQLVNGAVDEFGIASCRYRGDLVSIGSLNEEAIYDPRVADWEITFDEAALQAGDSIRAYMEQLIEGEQVIIVLSTAYFRSIFCMHELIGIYLKRAGKLLPVVVADNEFELTDNFEQGLKDFWSQEAKNALKDGNNAKAQKCQEIGDDLPHVLGWLLGPYDRKLAYFEDFLLKRDNEGKVFGAICTKLQKHTSIRYPVLSRSRRELELNEKIEDFVSDEDLKSELKLFDSTLVKNRVTCGVEVFLRQSVEVKEVEHALLLSGAWLDALKKAKGGENTDYSYLAFKLRELVGCLLMRLVDETGLQRLAHELNHQQTDARLQMLTCYKELLPIIIGAVCGDAAWFKLAEKGQLNGERELYLIERGIATENLENHLQSDMAWAHTLWGFYCQMNPIVIGEDAGEGQVPEDVSEQYDALRNIAEIQGNTGFYLPLDEEIHNHVDKINTLCSRMGEECPEITQVQLIAKTDDAVNNLIDSSIRSKIRVYVLNIYSKLRELTHGKRANR